MLQLILYSRQEMRLLFHKQLAVLQTNVNLNKTVTFTVY